MTWEQYARGQENEAFGRFLIETIAAHVGADPNPRSIDRRIYKDTANGLGIVFDSLGVRITASVEETNWDHGERVDLEGIDTDEAGAKLLCERFDQAIETCETLANEAWDETHDEDGKPRD